MDWTHNWWPHPTAAFVCKLLCVKLEESPSLIPQTAQRKRSASSFSIFLNYVLSVDVSSQWWFIELLLSYHSLPRQEEVQRRQRLKMFVSDSFCCFLLLFFTSSYLIVSYVRLVKHFEYLKIFSEGYSKMDQWRYFYAGARWGCDVTPQAKDLLSLPTMQPRRRRSTPNPLFLLVIH